MTDLYSASGREGVEIALAALREHWDKTSSLRAVFKDFEFYADVVFLAGDTRNVA